LSILSNNDNITLCTPSNGDRTILPLITPNQFDLQKEPPTKVLRKKLEKTLTKKKDA
jgi:hypothetical protein